MRLVDRVESLKEKHADLERQIDDEVRHLCPNTLAVKDMKRKKLMIKDELDRLAH